MKITAVEFVKSCFSSQDFPVGNCPEIAFIGRSNVGKSSAINALLGRKGIARVSSIPGKTQQINFFKVNHSFHFVDLPGYGYAVVPKEVRVSWAPFLEAYLMHRKQLKGVVFLLDARHSPTDLDLQMKSWLDHSGIAILVVITKTDKISLSDQRRVVREHLSVLGFGPSFKAIPFSAKTGAGRDELWRSIQALLNPHSERNPPSA